LLILVDTLVDNTLVGTLVDTCRYLLILTMY
jgi:hypothetical protein